MSYARQMLDTYPRTFNVDAALLAAAIDALDDCAQVRDADNAPEHRLGQSQRRRTAASPSQLELRPVADRSRAGRRATDLAGAGAGILISP